MGSVLKFGQRVPKSPEFLDGWKTCYAFFSKKREQINFAQQPTIICFPGDGTIDDEQMNGCCKNIEFMLKHAKASAVQMPRLYSLGFDA